jgi:sec-independent protein translocase protein TatC
MSAEDDRMGFTSHLEELRKRLIVSVAAIAVGFAVAYNYSDAVYAMLARPLLDAMPRSERRLVFTGVVEPFFIYFKVGLAGGVVLASPVVLYEAWAFVAPALYRKERRWFAAIVASSSVLFSAGAYFAYRVVFPFGFKYLLGYSSADLRPMLSMGAYFSMATRLLLAFGLVFQLPLVMMVLARLGVVTAGKLIGWWRYALVVILLASAILTPTPDVFNQALMAGPLIVLYAIGIAAAKLFGRRKEAAVHAASGEETA